MGPLVGVWGLALACVHFFLDEKTNQKNHRRGRIRLFGLQSPSGVPFGFFKAGTAQIRYFDAGPSSIETDERSD
jgi:hypothetical protein